MLGIITGFIDELRAAGVPVSMVEAIDGMRAVEAIEIGDRIALRETLRATLIKNLRHESAFDTAFDVYFATVPQQLPEPSGPGEHPAQTRRSTDLDEPPPFDLDSRLLESLLEALAGLDDEAIRRGARTAVDEPGRDGAGPAGRRYLLPVPDAASTRPGRFGGEIDLGPHRRPGPLRIRPASAP